METERINGLVFVASDIRRIIEDATPWLHMLDEQTFFVRGVEEGSFIPGTRVNTKVVGIVGDIDEPEVQLLFERISTDANTNTFSVPVSVKTTKDMVHETFDIPYILSGTYAQMVDGEIDILTEEEREFRDCVNSMLADRTDIYADMFRENNVKSLSNREQVLFHKMKAEIKHDVVLKNETISPMELVAYFIDTTAAAVQVFDELEQLLDAYSKMLLEKKEDLTDEYDIRKMEKDTKVLTNKIDELKKKKEYYENIIDTVILPVLA